MSNAKAGTLDAALTPPFDLWARPKPVGIPLDPSEVVLVSKWDELESQHQYFGRQQWLIVAWRAAKRVEVLAVRRALRAELLTANIEMPEADDFLCERYAANAADTAANGGPAADAADYAIAAAASVAATVARDTRAAGEARRYGWELVSLDAARLRKIASADPPLAPLIGWDDPRLGPLWPDGPPEWHVRAEKDVREMRAKLASRRDPTAPPMHEDTRRQFDDYKALAEMGRRGELDQYRGEYVVVFRGELVGHGPDLNAIRKQVAPVCGVPASRIVGEYIR